MFKLFVTLFAMYSVSALAATTKSKSAKPSSGQTSLRKTEVAPRLDRPRIMPTIGLATFDLASSNEARSDEGLFVGVNGQVDRGPLGLVAGIAYLQAGAKFSNPDVKVNVLLDYIMFNAAVKAYTPSRRLYLTGGLAPLVNLHSTYEARGFGREIKGKVHNVRDIDVLAKAGVGFEIPLQNTGVKGGVDLSLYRGLLDAQTGPGVIYHQGAIVSGFLSL